MTTLTTDLELARAVDANITDDTLAVDLADGRSLAIPLAWFPRLLHGSPEERQEWRMIGDGQGLHWNRLDEDISIEGLLAGRPSGESEKSLKRWLEKRKS